jgi:peroxiredoxin
MRIINQFVIAAFLIAGLTVNPTYAQDQRPGSSDKKHKRPDGHGGPEQTKTIDEIGGYQIGDVAADFSLKNVNKKMVSMSDYKDAKGFIIVFTCNECPFAKMYEDRMIALYEKYESQGYHLIAINPNIGSNDSENWAAMKKRAKSKAFPFPYLADEKKEIYPLFGAVRTPHVFVLDNERKVQYIGAIDNNAKDAAAVTEKYVENAISAISKGDKPSPNLTKAIGCPVKK